MTADPADDRFARFQHTDLTGAVIGVFFDVYNDLKPGYLECVYREAMVIALVEAGLGVAREVPVDVRFRGRVIAGFRLDLIVERVLVVELKAVSALASTHRDQLVNYLRCTDLELGLLLNFGPKPEVKRAVHSNDLKRRKRGRDLRNPRDPRDQRPL